MGGIGLPPDSGQIRVVQCNAKLPGQIHGLGAARKGVSLEDVQFRQEPGDNHADHGVGNVPRADVAQQRISRYPIEKGQISGRVDIIRQVFGPDDAEPVSGSGQAWAISI